MTDIMKLWGYKPNGEARLFAIRPGEKLPAGWSEDIMAIKDPALRTGDAVSAAAGTSVTRPVPVSHETMQAVNDMVAMLDDAPEDTFRYDENNQLIPPPKKRL